MSVDSIYVEKIPFAQKQRAGVNCFGKQAHQPMLVSARIDFRETFFVDDHFVPTLADSDNLETQRTMNYATLSKTIANLNSIEEDVWQPLDELLSEVLVAIRIGVLDGPESSNSLLRTCVDIELPKGSMLGNGLVASMALEEDTLYEGSLQIKRSLTYKSLTIPVEIGLRDYERGILQPICIDMTLSEIGEGQLDLYQQFEQMCIKIVQGTSFKTLEALARYTVEALYIKFLRQNMPGASIRLRISKPRVLADTAKPSVEVFRSAAALQKMCLTSSME